MKDAFRIRMEQAVLRGPMFHASPHWHFLFLENTGVLNEMMAFLPETDRISGALGAAAAFADPHDLSAPADACAALNRIMQEAGEETGCRFSEPLTRFFSMRRAGELCEALGVPGDYICVGVLVFTKLFDIPEEKPAWDVFSYLK